MGEPGRVSRAECALRGMFSGVKSQGNVMGTPELATVADSAAKLDTLLPATDSAY